MGARRGSLKTLELVLGTAEPANACCDQIGAGALNTLETSELVPRATEPARALFNMGILGSQLQTLKLIARAAEPTRAALHHGDRRSTLMHHLNTFAPPRAGEPAAALVDDDDVLGVMVAGIRLIGARVVPNATRRRVLNTRLNTRLNMRLNTHLAPVLTSAPLTGLLPLLPPLSRVVLLTYAISLRKQFSWWTQQAHRETESKNDFPRRHE